MSGEGAGGGLLFDDVMEHFAIFSNDIYPLLPQLWHAMLPSEKCVVMTIVERNGSYTLKCLHELYF